MTDRAIRAALAMAASLGVLLSLFGAVGAKASEDEIQTFGFELAAEQLEFGGTCREGGYVHLDELKQYIRLGSQGGVSYIMDAWGYACGRTHDRILRASFTLIDLAFYKEVCEGHRPVR